MIFNHRWRYWLQGLILNEVPKTSDPEGDILRLFSEI